MLVGGFPSTGELKCVVKFDVGRLQQLSAKLRTNLLHQLIPDLIFNIRDIAVLGLKSQASNKLVGCLTGVGCHLPKTMAFKRRILGRSKIVLEHVDSSLEDILDSRSWFSKRFEEILGSRSSKMQ